MNKAEAIKHFGSSTELAKALGVSKATISQWGESPPIGRQFQIQVITKAKLKAHVVQQ